MVDVGIFWIGLDGCNLRVGGMVAFCGWEVGSAWIGIAGLAGRICCLDWHCIPWHGWKTHYQ